MYIRLYTYICGTRGQGGQRHPRKRKRPRRGRYPMETIYSQQQLSRSNFKRQRQNDMPLLGEPWNKMPEIVSIPYGLFGSYIGERSSGP